MNDWIEYNRSWNDFHAEGLVNAGTQIEVEDKPLLIGDINCPDVVGDDIITRYRVLEIPQ